MKQRTSRWLSFLMALFMLLGLMPGTSFATNGAHPFTDVNDGDWFSDAIEYVYQNGLMNGTGSAVFSPYDPITRGQMVAILHRLDGTPSSAGASFTDVPSGEYYADAVAWANANGIMGGYGGGFFGPADNITREQLAATMYRYAQYKGYDTTARGNVASFSDGGTVSSYAVEAVNWAIGSGLFTGVDNNMFAPADSSNRAQAATILMRFCENTASSGGNTTPKDTYTVTFDYNYGGKGTYTTASVENGKTVSSPTNPSRSGYTFDGWYTAASGGSKFDFGTAVTSDLTLYAHWTSASSGGGGGSGGGSSSGSGNTPPVDPPEDDETYTIIEDYFDDAGLTVLDTVSASTSLSVQTEAEVKELLEARGFGQRQIEGYTTGYPITYGELMDGTFIDETEVRDDSDVKHPLYSTFYLANSDTEDPVLWTIYEINGSVFAYPASFSAQTGFDKEVIVTENADGSVTSYYDGTYYNLGSGGESVVTKPVGTIDAAALDEIDFDVLCSLTGTSRIDMYDDGSYDSGAYLQADTADAGSRASQNVPTHYGEKFIAIALGDSYISGESISPYIGQYDENGRAVSRENRVNDNNWLSHRSTASWPSRLSIPGISGNLKNYYVPYHEKSDANIQWYFYAISGAKTENYATLEQELDEKKYPSEYEFKKDYTLPSLAQTSGIELPFHKNLPPENEVFEYIDDPDEIDYVFLSLGGNDANFADIVIDVVLGSPTLSPATWFGGDSKLVRDLNEVWDRRYEIIDDIANVIIDIHKRARNATIIQTGYPRLYSEDVGSSWTASEVEAELVNEKVSDFNDLIRENIESLADSMDVRFVDIEAKFADGDHGAYSHDKKAGVNGAWLNPVIIPARGDDLKLGLFGISSAASMHPNTYGADAYAEAVNDVIKRADNDRKAEFYPIITGVVKDAITGTALEGVDVNVYDKDGFGPLFTGKADSNGAFSIDLDEAGTYNLQFIKEGYKEKALDGILVSERTTNIGTVELEPVALLLTPAISGAVKDSDTGLALEDVEVYVYDEHGFGPFFTGITDSDGLFSIKLEESGIYNLKFIKEGYEDYNLNDLTVIGETLTGVISLTSAGSVKFAGGDGTEENPYQIATPEQLAYLSEQVRDGEEFIGQYFKLIDDIDLSQYASWIPIGGYGIDNYRFKGNFDGNWHRISNMNIAESSGMYFGLFGYVHNSTIENIILDNVNISTGSVQVIGGIIGAAYASNISNCTVSGTISVESTRGLMCGGVVGIITGTSNIINCSNRANIDCGSSTQVGGIVGSAWATLNSTIQIIGCTNSGNIIGGDETGEIAGSYGAYPGSSLIIE